MEKVAVEKKAAEKKAAVQAAGKKKAAAEQAVGGAHAIVGWRCRRSKSHEGKEECMISYGGMLVFIGNLCIPLREFVHSSS